MKKVVIVIASLALAAFTAKGDYVIKQELENSGQVNQITLKIRGKKYRVDATEQTSAIIDSDTGDTTLLIHPLKAFLRIGAGQLKEQAEALKSLLGKKADNPAEIQLKPTGKKETINGFDTEEYTTRLNGVELTTFIAKQFPNYQRFVDALSLVQNGPALEAFRSMSLPPEKYPGMPIRTEERFMGQKIVVTLESAQETSLADNEFTVPSDYKELNPGQPERTDNPQEKSHR